MSERVVKVRQKINLSNGTRLKRIPDAALKANPRRNGSLPKKDYKTRKKERDKDRTNGIRTNRSRQIQDVNESILEAARIIGGGDELVGYFLKLHNRDFRIFARMVEKVMPLVHKITSDMKVVKFSREEIMAELAKRGIDTSTVKTLELSPREYRRNDEEAA